MSGEPQLRSVRPDQEQEPLIFISHRHADRRIADRVRTFLREKSGDSVAVFQSSSADAQSPRIGQSISRELVSVLRRTDVLLLIYTGNVHGWDYCMWECGVATRPESTDTTVIVLQCGPDRPRVFEDQLTVNARDQDMLRRFVNSFLTDSDFFPGRDQSVTRFTPNGDSVQTAARELYAALQETIGPEERGQTEKWQALPYVQLGLTAEHVQQIVDQAEEAQARVVTETLLQGASVDSYGGGAETLFGKLSLPVDAPFGQIFSRPLPEGRRPGWFRSLAGQITRAAQWRWPRIEWSVMRSANDTDLSYYSPVLTHVSRFPSKAMQFDVHFHRFSVPAGSTSIQLPLEDEGRTEAREPES